VLFYENTDRVRFQYIKLQNGSGTSANGSTATVGLQGHVRDNYTAAGYSFNTASLVEGLVIEYGTDSDGDRIPDGVERQYGTNQSSRFSDGGTPVYLMRGNRDLPGHGENALPPFPRATDPPPHRQIVGNTNAPKCGPALFALTRSRKASVSRVSSGVMSASTWPRAAACRASSCSS